VIRARSPLRRSCWALARSSSAARVWSHSLPPPPHEHWARSSCVSASCWGRSHSLWCERFAADAANRYTNVGPLRSSTASWGCSAIGAEPWCNWIRCASPAGSRLAPAHPTRRGHTGRNNGSQARQPIRRWYRQRRRDFDRRQRRFVGLKSSGRISFSPSVRVCCRLEGIHCAPSHGLEHAPGFEGWYWHPGRHHRPWRRDLFDSR